MERLPAPRMKTWAHLWISLAGGQDGEFEGQLEMLTAVASWGGLMAQGE